MPAGGSPLLVGLAQPGRVLTPQLKTGTVDTALDGGNGELERLGNLLVREPLHVAEHEWYAGVERERADTRGDEGERFPPGGLDVGRSRTGARRGVGAVLELGLVVEGARIQAFPSRPLERLVDGDPVEPRERRRAAAEAIEVAPRLHEGVLGGLVDVALVVEDATEDSAHSAFEKTHELGECVEVALLRALEKLGFMLGHATTL